MQEAHIVAGGILIRYDGSFKFQHLWRYLQHAEIRRISLPFEQHWIPRVKIKVGVLVES
jgi:hypothetical protein